MRWPSCNLTMAHTWQICSEVRWYLALLWRLGTARQCGPPGLTDHGTFCLNQSGENGMEHIDFTPKMERSRTGDEGFWKPSRRSTCHHLAISAQVMMPSPWTSMVYSTTDVPGWARAGRAEPGCEISTALARWGISWCCWVCCSDEGRLDFARIKGNQVTLLVDFVKSIHCIPLCNSTWARNTWEHSPKWCSLHGPLLLCRCTASTLQFFWV